MERRPQAPSAPEPAPIGASQLGASPVVDELLRDLAVAAAGIGVFDWDLTTGTLSWDDRLLDMFGYDRSEFGGTIEAFNDRVHPDDLPTVSDALATAITTCGEYEAEYRVVLPGGVVRWLGARGRALPGPDGRCDRVIGAAYDITVHREADARVVEVLESMPAAFFSLDPDWRFVYVNGEAERLLGMPRQALVGAVLWELFPAAQGSQFEAQYRRAMSDRVPVSFEEYYPPPLDAWYEVRAWPSRTGLSVYFLEITARRRAQDDAARSADSAELLAEVTRQLSETLDAREGVGRLARIMVPRLADWCLVTLVDTDGSGGDWRRSLHDVGWSHADPGCEPLVAGYATTRKAALTDASPIAVALARGEPVIITDDATQRFTAALAPGEAADAMASLAPGSAVVVPLLGRDRTVGLITLYNGTAAAPRRPARCP